jgi:hypothetical protein
MKHLIGSLFAIGLAAVAAIAATTALLNTPVRTAPATALSVNAPAPANPTAPAATPDPASKPATPDSNQPGAAKPADGSAAPPAGAAGDAQEDEADADPYEGIAPEELPPDLQYSADSSVSFPTNI